MASNECYLNKGSIFGRHIISLLTTGIDLHVLCNEIHNSSTSGAAIQVLDSFLCHSTNPRSMTTQNRFSNISRMKIWIRTKSTGIERVLIGRFLNLGMVLTEIYQRVGKLSM